MTDDWRSRCKDCWYTCEKIEDCIFPKDSGVSEMTKHRQWRPKEGDSFRAFDKHRKDCREFRDGKIGPLTCIGNNRITVYAVDSDDNILEFLFADWWFAKESS